MNKTITVVRWNPAYETQPNERFTGVGKYVQDFQYSQGYFDCELTDNIFEAKDFTGKLHLYQTFFSGGKGQLAKFELTATEVPLE